MASLLPEWIDLVAEEAHAIALSMLEEKGRGAVLVGAARVDTALEALLKAALAPPSSRETLFHPDRPLGSFGARIALAQRLGLIDPALEQALHALRRVRNAFAHPTASAVLSDPSHQQRLAESYRLARANPLWQPLEQVLEQHQPRPDPALRDYILLITILVAFLEAAARQLIPVQPLLVLALASLISNP